MPEMGPPSKQRKVNGVLYPNSLLSTRNPEEEVIAPGAAASGWVQRSLSPENTADAFDLL
eukprot:8409228-Ditylum_brightwellii.AAC.1